MTQFISPNDIAKEYGGEPLLNMSFIKKIVSYVDKLDLPHKNLKFSMTTNAMLLEKIPKKPARITSSRLSISWLTTFQSICPIFLLTF